MKKRKQTRTQEAKRPTAATALVASALGLVTGLCIIYFHAFNNLFNAYYHSNRLLYDKIAPVTFEVLNRLSGFGIITLTILCILYGLFLKQRTERFLKRNYKAILFLLLCGICALTLYSSFLKYFHNDEIEHIHSAWYVKNSFIPYRDFFQHHNPLLWYLLAPLLHVLGDSLNVLPASRFFMVSISLGTTYLAYLVAFTITRSRETGLISAVLMFSTVIFPEKAIEIRPDIPQIFFGMLSIYLFIRFYRDRNDRFLVLSGLSAALSFLFLQKAIFLLFSYSVILIHGIAVRKIRARSAAYFAGSLVLPLLLFLACLHLGGALHDYYITNVVVNLHHFGSSGLSFNLLQPLWNTLTGKFWLFIIGALALIPLFRDRKSPPEMKIVTFVGLVELSSLALFTHVYKHFLLFAITILCVPCAWYLTRALDSLRVAEAGRTVLFVFLLWLATPFLIINSLHTNRPQYEKMNYVLSVTKNTDLVHDGANTFNLFRRDLHYFWFQLGVGLSNYNRATGGRYDDYDVCKLIRRKRPKITSAIKLDFDRCGLWDSYDPTRFKYTYIRRD